MGNVRQVRVDGRPVEGWRLVSRGLAPTPFQLQGPALDGDVVEVELGTKPVGEGRTVEVTWA
jgi:hypothetical protein